VPRLGVNILTVLLCCAALSFSASELRAQTDDGDKHDASSGLIERQGAVDKSDRLHYDYKLGPDDVITVQVADDESFKGKPIRISSAGTINLPLVGREVAAGKTAADLEDQIAKDLAKYMVSPQVSVSITDYRSQPVSVLGAVNKPGVYQLEGPRTLAQMLALAGGLAPDAGYQLKLTRQTRWGLIPLPGAITDRAQKFNTAKVEVNDLVDGGQAEENIDVKPFDVLFIPKGQMVYVMGEVTRAGGFVLHDQQSLSVLEAVSMAGGYTPRAALKKARILRSVEGKDQRQEVALNLKALSNGQAADVRLLPRDVLVIPNDTAREFRIRAIETAIGLGTGILIWRR
jgi:polysaccharide biosynthesis/export protein